MSSKIHYESGLGNYISTEVVKNTLPLGQNSPQKVAHGLYAEQINGSAFTAPRARNLRSWMYRILPSAVHSEFKPYKHSSWQSFPINDQQSPLQLRWDPFPFPKIDVNLIDSVTTYCGNGNLKMNVGCAVHMYSCNESMKDYFSNADGQMLFVPQEGALLLATEMGQLEVSPNEIAVIPRGIKFKAELLGKNARGYICENYGSPFQLPELGPIGANGLANARDFKIPTAWFEDTKKTVRWITKFGGNFWSSELKQSPLNVVGWHGNYYPYKYNLNDFNTIGSISFDHPDPSIFTVLTSPSVDTGTANIDFVIFPPRWLVGENTFRPPYYHRNYMSEFMGLIHGEYDAKKEGFLPGGASLHNRMSGHGPDAITFENASAENLKPQKIENTMAFMFESQYPFDVTPSPLNSGLLQKNYLSCWKDLKPQYK